MASKVNTNSPTANIFALLADVDQPQKKARTAAKGASNELTPKERAEAKAVQEAEAKAKKEAALKVKQAQEAARKARAAEGPVDDTGFTQQRHQRIKESRTTPVEAPKAKDNKGKKGPKNNKEERVKSENTEFVKAEKTDKVAKGEKTYNNKPNRGREFDKQSQGTISRKPAAKKGGHGRGNWDKQTEAVAPGTTAESATTPAATTEAEWADAPDATPAVEGEEVAVDAVAEVAAEGEWVEEEEVDNSVSYADYLAAQAEKAKELGAQYSRAQPRALSADETAALAKFTAVENTKVAKKVTKEVKENKTAPAKKQVVTVETNFAYPPRDGGDARPQRGPRRGGKNQNQGDKKGGKNAARPAKLPRGGNFDAQFPTLA